MFKILVLYGTTDGHTATIANRLADTLRTNGCGVDVFDAARTFVRPDDYAAVIVAASVHARGYQRQVRRWVTAHARALATRPTAFVSVCLGVLQPDAAVQQEVSAIAARFLEASGWRPARTKIVAGALLYTRYSWLKRCVMKHIVAKAGGDTDTTRDYEYTDWNDLEAFGAEFAALVRMARARANAETPSVSAA